MVEGLSDDLANPGVDHAFGSELLLESSRPGLAALRFRRRRCGGFVLGPLDAGLVHHLGENRAGGFRMFFEELFGRFPPLTDSLSTVGIPRAALFDDAHFAAEVDDFAVTGNAGAVKNI